MVKTRIAATGRNGTRAKGVSKKEGGVEYFSRCKKGQKKKVRKDNCPAFGCQNLNERKCVEEQFGERRRGGVVIES